MLTNFKKFFKQQKANIRNTFADTTSYYLEFNLVDLKCDPNFEKTGISSSVEDWKSYLRSGKANWNECCYYITKKVENYLYDTFKEEIKKDPKFWILDVGIGSLDDEFDVLIRMRCNRKEIVDKIISTYGMSEDEIKVQPNFYKRSIEIN